MKKRRGLLLGLLVFIALLAASPWMVRKIESTFFYKPPVLQLTRETTIPFSGNWGWIASDAGIYLLRTTEVRHLSPRKEEDWTLGTDALAPVAVTGAGGVFLQERAPRYYVRISQQGHLLYHQAAHKAAEDMAVCDAGYLLVRHPEENRMNAFSILDPEGRVTGSFDLTEGVVINTTISGAHNRILVALLRMTGNTYESVLLSYDLRGTLQSSKSLPEQLLIDTVVTQEGNVVLLTEETLQVYSQGMEKKWQMELEPYYAYAHESGEKWVMAHRGEKNSTPSPDKEIKTVVTVIDAHRREVDSFAATDELLDIHLQNDQMAARIARGFQIYETTGSLLDQRGYQTEVEAVMWVHSNELGVIRRGQIRFYRLRGNN